MEPESSSRLHISASRQVVGVLVRVASRGMELDRGSQYVGAETRGNLGVLVGHAAPGARMVRAIVRAGRERTADAAEGVGVGAPAAFGREVGEEVGQDNVCRLLSYPSIAAVVDEVARDADGAESVDQVSECRPEAAGRILNRYSEGDPGMV